MRNLPPSHPLARLRHHVARLQAEGAPVIVEQPTPEALAARAAVAVDYQRKAAARAANARACLCAVATSTDPGPFILRNQEDAARAYRMARLAAGIES